ncbi:hypothetical protein NC652_038994 [Populus alba x Populus x berolinensis]|nr:hypothetical protein NC652_038994 [Populus alba x Populus x berolinensis]
MIGSCLLGVRMESRRWDFELKEKVLCLLLADSANLFQLELHGGTSTQPQMVESSMNTPLWSGSNGYQTSTSNLVWARISLAAHFVMNAVADSSLFLCLNLDNIKVQEP